jgi:type II secretion system protein H
VIVRSPDAGYRPGRPRQRGGAQGFTLIELLVVVVIVGVVMAVVGLSLAPESEDRALRREGERLALLLEAVSLEAAVSGRVLAWSHSASGYSFWTRDPLYGWVALEGDDMFRPRDFNHRAAVARVESEGRPLEANERLVFRPAGVRDYTVELRLGASALNLRGDPTGRVGLDDAR